MEDCFKKSVVYQIYPKSFKDSNNDGIGDIRGIIEKLDYLGELGVDIIWLCPVYQSPQDDNGYDISDYRAIYPPFGTLDDMKALIDGCHKRKIGLMMDLVVNHTSDEHMWFKEARKSRDNPYRDFYIWKDAKGFDENGKPIPPNNWGSFFSGSAWEWDDTTNQFYLHLFTKKQPDLNWENESVRKEIYDMMNWWMDTGVDGWRLDTCNLYSKPPDFQDFPGQNSTRYTVSPMYAKGPRAHEFIKEMNREVFSGRRCITVGEAAFGDIIDGIDYTSPERCELNMIFSFEHMGADEKEGSINGKWDAGRLDLSKLKRIFEKWQKKLHGRGWNSLYWNNHDQPRIVSRWGDDGEYRVKSAKMLSAILHFMDGTPYIYQGEEIGMINCRYDLVEYNDIEIHNAYREIVLQQKTMTHDEFVDGVYKKGRDNARTPFQWDSSENGGFSLYKPWLKVNPNYSVINAENDVKSHESIFYWYQKLITLRKSLDIVTMGDFELLLPDDNDIFAYRRSFNGQVLTVIGNFSARSKDIKIDAGFSGADIIMTNYDDRMVASDRISIRPWEIIVTLGGRCNA